jgi:micrococcal nuclease
VTVTRVVDGDTLEVEYSNGTTETVRLLGVDTPETYGSVDPPEWEGIPDDTDGRQWLQGWGENATAYAEQRLGGKQIYMQVDSEADRRGSYGRLLVYVSQSQYSSTSFNYRLLENGYARFYDSTFSRSSRFASAESTAMSGDVGVWGYSPPDPSTSSSIQIANIHEDAAGDEYDNLDDEYVTFENTGSSAVDMTGWTLSDSAGNTYPFPDGYSLEAGATVRVITGSDSDSSTLDWGQEAPVWNNGGDTATLNDDTGEQVDEQTYD